MRRMIRNRLGLMMIAGLATTGTAALAAENAEIETATVEVAGAAGPIKAYQAKPKGDGPFPAIVVIHEWWGLTDWVKQNADRLAEHGYVALAVDLYGGKVTDDPKQAINLMQSLQESAAIADLKGAAAYLKAQTFVARDKQFGAIGWCMGGKYSRLAAQASEAVGPIVICYGQVSADPADVAKLKGKPVLGIFGAEDAGIPASKVKQFGKAVETTGSPIEIKIYPGAGHGFMRSGGTAFDSKATADAWAKIDAFFKTNLK